MAPKSVWVELEETKLIAFLTKIKAEAGDNVNFKLTHYNDAVRAIASYRVKGPVKTASAVKRKWSALRDTYWVVVAVATQSGWHWDDEKGASIDAETASSWDAYVLAHPKAEPFRNCGWVHYQAMKDIMPKEPKGKNAYHANIAAATSVEADSGSGAQDVGSDGEKDSEKIPWSESDGEKGKGGEKEGESESESDNSESEEEDGASGSKQCHPSTSKHTNAKHSHSETFFAFTSRISMKKPKDMSNSAHAIHNIANKLSNFNTLYCAAIFGPDPSQQSAIPGIPSRKKSAVQRAQRLEDYLDDEQMVKLLKVFQNDVSAADTYLAIERDSLRKAWVNDAIGQ